MSGENRLKIGILVGGIADDYSIQLCLGVMHTAARKDVNVFVFPGKYIDRLSEDNDEIAYEYQYNTLFAYPNANNIDGLIIAAGSIGCFTTAEKTDEFLRGFDDIPCVIAATKDSSRCCICYDNRNAVREGVLKLINDCGCRHLCIVAGPSGNTDAMERENAFYDTLEEAGLKYSESSKQVGDLACTEKTADAIERLMLDNPDMDGLFCVNDEMAIMAYEVLAKHGKTVGKDVFVMGYDNVVNSAKMDPPLSTVAADPFNLGDVALTTLLKKIRGEKTESVTIPARLIIRESFGKIEKTAAQDADVTEIEIRDYFNSSFYRFLNECDKDDAQKVYEIFKGIMLKAKALDSESESAKEDVAEIADGFDVLFHTQAMAYVDVDMIVRYIGHAYRAASAAIHNNEIYKAKLFDSALQTTHSLVKIENSLLGELIKEQKDRDISIKNFIRKTMNFKHGTDQSYRVFLDDFDWLDVKNACIYVLDRPCYHLKNEKYRPAPTYNRKAVLKDGQVKILPKTEQPVLLDRLFDIEEFGDRQRAMALLPLFFAEELYGFVMFDLTDKIFGEAECIASQLGASTHILMMLKENERIRQELEESLTLMKQMNIELDNLSRTDHLTGLYNRRGFVEEGENYLHEAAKRGEISMVGFADMNNLKIVNDRFGHEEGDFSLKKIAEVFGTILGKDAVIGRIGGDEYAFVTTESVTGSYEILRHKVDGLLDTFNKTSDKPYNISVSIGIMRADREVDQKLEEALSYADRMLYEAKRSKDKNVIKQFD
ncbi:diguanylate cyclase domain-containing protein [Butyrivibrio sp. AC2005]|uniref:diguanylate cyclase domain-containing protein n=1 Tax=Butyrivibrio sp. AC2005 TaxID=1280672 RepID=UPI000418409D|nr:GGDEF domain-containing protein [Butyrivibrio sp. AC2005]